MLSSCNPEAALWIGWITYVCFAPSVDQVLYCNLTYSYAASRASAIFRAAVFPTLHHQACQCNGVKSGSSAKCHREDNTSLPPTYSPPHQSIVSPVEKTWRLRQEPIQHFAMKHWGDVSIRPRLSPSAVHTASRLEPTALCRNKLLPPSCTWTNEWGKEFINRAGCPWLFCITVYIRMSPLHNMNDADIVFLLTEKCTDSSVLLTFCVIILFLLPFPTSEWKD